MTTTPDPTEPGISPLQKAERTLLMTAAAVAIAETERDAAVLSDAPDLAVYEQRLFTREKALAKDLRRLIDTFREVQA